MVESNGSNEILYSWAKVFANIYTLIYAVWFCYNVRLTFISSQCDLPMSYSGCITFLVALLIMALTSVFLADGLKGGRADELVPWLFCTLCVEIACIVLLFDTGSPQSILLSIILVLNIFTWFPIFSIYRRLSKNNASDEETQSNANPGDNCASTAATLDLNGSTATVSSVATEQNSLAIAHDKPPHYDSIKNTSRRKVVISIPNDDDEVPAYEMCCKIDKDSRTTEKHEPQEPKEPIHQ